MVVVPEEAEVVPARIDGADEKILSAKGDGLKRGRGIGGARGEGGQGAADRPDKKPDPDHLSQPFLDGPAHLDGGERFFAGTGEVGGAEARGERGFDGGFDGGGG